MYKSLNKINSQYISSNISRQNSAFWDSKQRLLFLRRSRETAQKQFPGGEILYQAEEEEELASALKAAASK